MNMRVPEEHWLPGWDIYLAPNNVADILLCILSACNHWKKRSCPYFVSLFWTETYVSTHWQQKKTLPLWMSKNVVPNGLIHCSVHQIIIPPYIINFIMQIMTLSGMFFPLFLDRFKLLWGWWGSPDVFFISLLFFSATAVGFGKSHYCESLSMVLIKRQSWSAVSQPGPARWNRVIGCKPVWPL